MSNLVHSIWNKHRLFLVFLAMYLFVVALTLNNTKPFKGDESFYITSSIRMVHTGNYLIPEYFGSIRLQKPILPYWMTVAGYRIFGIHLWSGRVAFLILALVLLVSLYRFSLYLSGGDTRFAFMNVLLLASTPLFVGFTRHAMCDLPYALFTTLSLFWLVRSMKSNRILYWYTGAFAWAGLACISKYILCLLPVLAFGVWMVIERPDGWKRRIAMLFHPLCIGVFLLITAPWYIYIWITEPGEFASQFLRESTAVSPSLGGAVSNVLYYLWVLVRMYFPFTILASYVLIKHRPSFKREHGPILIYCITMIFFFIVAVSRQRERYLLVLFPALTVILGHLFYQQKMFRTVLKTAIVLLFFESLVFLAYTSVAGEQVKDLVSYWKVNGDDVLSLPGLPRRKVSWAQALSGGAVVIDGTDTPWIITISEKLVEFPDYEVKRTAEIINTVRFTDGRFVSEKDLYYLLRKTTP